MDRGYAKFALFNAIVKHESSDVCRLRDNSVYEIVEERPLTDADRAVNVLSDQIVRIGLSAKAASQPDHPVRLVIVKIKPHVASGNARGVDSDGFLRIMTKRTHEMLCFYLMGWADEDELLAHLNKLKTRDAATAR